MFASELANNISRVGLNESDSQAGIARRMSAVAACSPGSARTVLMLSTDSGSSFGPRQVGAATVLDGPGRDVGQVVGSTPASVRSARDHGVTP